MQIKVNSNSFFVFDLDDTLFGEIDFLKSGYQHISTKLAALINRDLYSEMLQRYYRKENVFRWIADTYQTVTPEITVDWLLREYREHLPLIKLKKETLAFLEQLIDFSVPLGLITDGRSITQRNKLKALGIEAYFSDIIISEEFGSEKPNENNYLYFEKKYPGRHFYFFGDNTSKDFIVPNKLGWRTICIKNAGSHIHEQSFDRIPAPDDIISSFKEVELVYEN